MVEKESAKSLFPETIHAPPEPWFELVLRYLDFDQQRTIVARLMDMYISQQEQMLELSRMARDMLKEGRKKR